MVERFHADPRVQATELLLQERVPRHTPTIAAAAARRDARRRAGRRRCRSRRFRSPHTVVPARAVPLERQLRRPSSPTPAAAAASAAACAVTRSRRDPTRDPGSQFVYLRDVRSGAGLVGHLSADAARAGRLRGRVPRRAGDVPPARRRDLDAARRRRLDRRRRRGAAASR